MKKFCLALAASLLVVLVASLASAGVEGEYRTKGAGFKGVLIVTAQPDGSIKVFAKGVSAGGHLALIEGVTTVQGGEAVVGGEEGCQLKIQFKGDQAVLSNGDDTCRYYMGAAAAIDGVYHKVRKGNPGQGK